MRLLKNRLVALWDFVVAPQTPELVRRGEFLPKRQMVCGTLKDVTNQALISHFYDRNDTILKHCFDGVKYYYILPPRNIMACKFGVSFARPA